jgi:RimJ/RimL family protein N-acetyltransferase
MKPPPEIRTARFLLRPVRPDDLGALELHAGDERVARMTRTIPHPLPPGMMQGMIDRALAPDSEEGLYVIANDAGDLMGNIRLERMDRGQCEISYWVAPGLWGSGIATEALRALIEANPLGDKTMFAAVFQDNPVSARILSNLGFAYLGEAEYHSVARQAQVPTWTYLKKL